MNSAAIGSRKRPVYLGLALALACTTVMAAAWTFNTTSALASIPGLTSAATPTPGRSFGHVEIGKPTYTALPSPTFLPTDVPSGTPADMAMAEVIPDTPVPGQTVSAAEGSFQEILPSAPAYSGNKRILIDISEQHMYVYEGEAQVFSFVSSTGMNNATRTGSFSVLDKIPNAYGATWNIWMPNWLGIYWAGSLENGIHALPILPGGAQLWAGYLGSPISFGCIVIGTEESQLLFDWAEIGTPVEIQW